MEHEYLMRCSQYFAADISPRLDKQRAHFHVLLPLISLSLQFTHLRLVLPFEFTMLLYVFLFSFIRTTFPAQPILLGTLF